MCIRDSADSPQLLIEEADTTTTSRLVMSGGRLYIQVAQQGQGTSTSSGIMYLTGYNNTTASEIHLKANNTYNTGHFHLDANDYLKIGNNDDIQIYHNGSTAIAQNSTGNFYFGNYSNTNLIFQTNNTNRWAIWNTGHFIPDANNTVDIGSSSTRVRYIYTNDLNLSNKGSTNSIDNTWGDYTIQEGESDLFLINNRSGKKYKFYLTEVS